MIKFFRKIRRNLLSENPTDRSGSVLTGKVSKYMIYAIGEIVLVVIGILIALQINNWNESRKLMESEQKYLRELQTNLQVDLDDIDHSISFTLDKIRSNNAALAFVDSKIVFHDTLKQHFANLQGSLHFTPQTSAIDGIKIAEGINIVKSDTLRKAISYLYDLLYKHVMYIETEDEHRFQYGILIPVIQENIKITTLYQEAEPIEPQRIKENSKFRNAISTNLWYKKYLMSQYQLQKNAVKDLIQLISSALKSQ